MASERKKDPFRGRRREGSQDEEVWGGGTVKGKTEEEKETGTTDSGRNMTFYGESRGRRTCRWEVGESTGRKYRSGEVLKKVRSELLGSRPPDRPARLGGTPDLSQRVP